MSKRKPHPTQKELQEAFFYDEETGMLHWKIRPSTNIQVGTVAGYKSNDGYCYLKLKGREYLAQNIIWILNYGDIPIDLQVDHADRNRSNNVLENLRLATQRQQNINQSARGFSFCNRVTNPWKVAHRINGKSYYIGIYSTALQARLAYERYTSDLEPEFASTFFTDAFNRLLAA